MQPLHRVVARTVVLAVACAVGAMALTPTHVGAQPWWLILGLWCACAVGEIAYVRVRHGESTEDLTLFEAVVVVAAFLLSPELAILVPITALAAASAVLRRGWLKSLFNLGSYTIATCVLVGALSLVDDHTTFGPATLAAAVLGGLGFAAANLIALSRVLSVAEGVPAREILLGEWKLSALMAGGSVAIGCMGVSLARHDPVLLVCLALPVLTLTYAYRAAAARATVERRNHILLELTAALTRSTSREELLEVFSAGITRAFRAEEVHLVLADEERAEGPDSIQRQQLRALGEAGARALEPGNVQGWRTGVVAPVTHNEDCLGVVGLGLRSREGGRVWERLDEREQAPLGRDEVPVLASLAAALGAALAASSHLRQVAEESQKLQVVVDGAQEGILVLDETGRVLVWNTALEVSTGISAAQAAGSELEALLGEAAGELVARIRGLAAGEERATSELLLPHEGSLRELAASISGVRNEEGEIHRVVVMLHDVTLERRVGRLKDDFIATVSHELRTPITPIKGYAEMLLRRGDSLSLEKRTRMLTSILERTDHLARLVEDLLLSSRISAEGAQAGEVACEPVELAAVVASSVAEFPGLSGRVEIRGAREAWARGEATRIRQVLGNLLSNAEKYSAAPASVQVEVRCVGEQVEVSVEDHGVGIPVAEQSRVFDKFHRVEDAHRMSTGGSGLGLFIASELTRAMGGRLRVESEVGVGSKFTLSLPACETSPGSAHLPAGSAVTGDSAELHIPSQLTIPTEPEPPRPASARTHGTEL